MANLIYNIKNLQIRGDTSANLTRVNTILKEREICIEKDTNRIKIGDGLNPWNNLPYFSGADVDLTPLETVIDGKQDKLSNEQIEALNSGITQYKVSQYDAYANEINNKMPLEDAYNKVEIDERLAYCLRYNGTVDTDTDLPIDSNTGDMYKVIADGLLYVYDGMAWHPVDKAFDDSNLVEAIANKQDIIPDLDAIREGAFREITVDNLEFDITEDDVQQAMIGVDNDGE